MQVDRLFITQPSGPVVLTVTISSSDTATDTPAAMPGPHNRPPSAMTMSFGSYFKNSTTGTRMTATAA